MSRSTHRIPVTGGQEIVLDWYEPTTPPSRHAVFVHGLASDRRGEKARFFADRFVAEGWGFMSVDMRGHGDSDGSLIELTLSRCLEDLAAALAWMPAAEQPPVLIGSSMGGAIVAWQTIVGEAPAGPLIMLAPSVGFPGHFVASLPEAELEAWRTTGSRRLESQWIDVQLGYALAEDGRNYPMEKLRQSFDHRTLIIQGMQDDAVDWRQPAEFVETCPCLTLDLLLIKEGDHRLTDYKAYLADAMMNWLQRLERAG